MAWVYPEVYWNSNPSGWDNFTTHYERTRYVSAIDWAQKVIGTNDRTLQMTMDPKTFFRLKQELANVGNDGNGSNGGSGNGNANNVARFLGDADDQEEQRLAAGILTPEESALLSQVDNEASKAILQTYYNAYMAPFKSDLEYRLGNVQGVYLKTEGVFSPDYGLINSRGRMYTRTNFTTSFPLKYWSGASVNVEQIGLTDSSGRLRDPTSGFFYTNLFFPPYKFGQSNDVTKKSFPYGWSPKYYSYDTTDKNGETRTVVTNELLYDPRDFTVKRDGFTYREPAFKAINDNIMFLQYLLERSCGIVSTYLTEWDLSVYMQEAIVTQIEKLPSKVWLLYRIQDDNPLAYRDTQSDPTRGYDFRDSKAYSFGVVNAAVSKLFGSNQKPWRPSDYPLSAFWSPYVTGVHFQLKYADMESLVDDGMTKVPYLDFWDRAAEQFDYEKKIVGGKELARTTKEKVVQTDFVQACQAGWADFNMMYYQALYTTPDDSLSDMDVELAAARQAGWSTAKLINTARESMLTNGGAESGMGVSSSAGSYSSQKSTIIKRIIKGRSGGEVDPNAKTQELSQASKQASKKLADAVTPAVVKGDTLQGNKVTDTSKMAKDTGISYSPVLYGGPHGSYFSPHTTHSYFDKDTLYLRDIPRVNPITDWSSQDKSTYRKGNDSWYYNPMLSGDQSPNEAIHNAKQGFQSYVTAYAQAWVSVTRQFDGQVHYHGRAKRCITVTLPSHCEGYPIQYEYIEKTVFGYPDQNYFWNNQIDESNKVVVREPRIWYTTEYMITNTPYVRVNRTGQWLSYWNDFNVSKYLGNGRWSVAYRCPHCIGTYWHWIYRSYKKLLLHDEPNLSWYIRPYQWYSYTTGVSTWRAALSRAAARFGGFKYAWAYKEPYVYNVGFRLVSPGNAYQGSESQYRVDIRDDIYGWTSYTFSGNESAILHKMVRLPGTVGNGAELLFCQGPSYDVPHCIFSSKVFTVNFPMFYWRRHERTYSSRKKRVWYTLEVAWAITLMVDMWSQSRFFSSDLHRTPYSNMHVGKYNTINSSFEPNHLFSFPGKRGGSGTVTASRRNLNDPLELMADPAYLYRTPELIAEIRSNWRSTYYFSQSFSWGFYTYFNYGSVNGVGLLSSIQGFDPNTDGMKTDFDDPTKWVRTINWTPKQTFENVQYQCHQVSYNPAGTVVDIDGTKWYNAAGIISWKAVTMPTRIKNALVKRITTATFYKSDMTDDHNLDVAATAAIPWVRQYVKLGHPYLVTLDTTVRVFFSQLLYQCSFLDVSRDMLVDSVDFKNVRTLLRGAVDKVVLAATKPETPGYSYWIQKAVEIFGSSDDQVLVTNKAKVVAQVNQNTSAYTAAIKVLNPLVKKDIKKWSYDDWSTAIQQMLSVQAQNDSSVNLSDYYMAYLNVLYEIRKYYICMRFNKEDGTMWTMRALESIMPWTNDVIPPVQPPPSSAFNNTKHTPGGAQYGIAFYELNNNLDKKADALKKGTILPEDAIKVVYVKVKWASVDDYNAWVIYDRGGRKGEEVAEVAVVQKPLYTKQVYDGANGTRLERQVLVGYEPRFAFVPENNTYTLISTEWEKAEKDRKWNEAHAEDISSGRMDARKINPVPDTVSWQVTWKDTKTHTPIIYDIFSNVDVARLIEYSQKSASTQELLCFSKKDADYWRVQVMGSEDAYNDRPRKVGHKTKLRIKAFGSSGAEGSVSTTDDMNFTITGALGYSVWPIIETTDNPILSDVTSLQKNIHDAYSNALLGS